MKSVLSKLILGKEKNEKQGKELIRRFGLFIYMDINPMDLDRIPSSFYLKILRKS